MPMIPQFDDASDDAISFTPAEINAIAHAQYIVDSRIDPIDEEFTWEEKAYYLTVALNALNRNIEICRFELSHLEYDSPEYLEYTFYMNQFMQNVTRINS